MERIEWMCAADYSFGRKNAPEGSFGSDNWSAHRVSQGEFAFPKKVQVG